MSKSSYIPALSYTWLTEFYDPAMATLFQERLFRGALIDALELRAGQRVLDIGCGTGTVELLLHKHNPDLWVVGLDIDPAVLAIAKRKAQRNQVAVAWLLASATTLPYADESFDHVLSSLMFHHLTHEQKGAMLANTVRVLRPDGLLSILDFGPPQAHWLASLLKTQLSGFEHIDDNLQGRVPELLTQAGFVDVRVCDIAFAGLIKLYQGRKGRRLLQPL